MRPCRSTEMDERDQPPGVEIDFNENNSLGNAQGCTNPNGFIDQRQLEKILHQAVQAMDNRHTKAMATVVEDWTAKYDEVQVKLDRNTVELAATKQELQEARGPLKKLSKLVQVQSEQLVSVSDQCTTERRLIADMIVDMDNRFQALVALNHDQQQTTIPNPKYHKVELVQTSPDHQRQDVEVVASGTDAPEHSATISSSIANVQSTVENQLREVQFDLLQEQVQSQARQINFLQEDVQLIREDGKSQSKGEDETSKAESKEYASDHSSSTVSKEPFDRIDQVRFMQDVEEKCQKLIQKDHERLMGAWGTQFEGLATHVQEVCDQQAATMCDTRADLFEHVDTEAEARATMWVNQYNQLVTSVQQHSRDIDDIKEDQERALIIVVETMVNLKLKVADIVEQISERSESQCPVNVSDVDINSILDVIERKGKLWNNKFSKYTNELKDLKKRLKVVDKETLEGTNSRREIHSILEQSIQLFQAKTETCFDLWTVQFADLERRMQARGNAAFSKVEDHERLKADLAHYVTVWNKQFIKLAGQVDRKIGLATKNSDDSSPSATSVNGCVLFTTPKPSRRKVTFHDIENDEKKYKKALSHWRDQRKMAIEANAKHDSGDPSDDIEFYDLTFIDSRDEPSSTASPTE